MTPFSNLDWALVPGPVEVLDILDSQGQFDVALYPPDEIAELVLGIDGTLLLKGGTDWWDWRASYETDSEIFELTMTLFDMEPIVWGGSGIVGCSDPAALLWFWEQLRNTHPRIWLHNSECTMFNPKAFRRDYIG